MANFALHVVLDDIARARGTSRQILLDDLRKQVVREMPSGVRNRDLIFNEKRGAFELVDSEDDIRHWADPAVRDWIVNNAREPVLTNRPLSPSILAFEPGADHFGRGDWAVLVMGRATPKGTEISWETFQKLVADIRDFAAEHDFPAFVSPSREGTDEESVGVLIGCIAAASESTAIPGGPYLVEDFEPLTEALWQLAEQRIVTLHEPTGVYLAAVGKYASAYAIAGCLEKCPSDPTSEAWPELYCSPDFHAQFNGALLQPSIGIRGSQLGACGPAQRFTLLPKAMGNVPVFLQVRTFEEEEDVGKSRAVHAALSYSSLNSVELFAAPSPPHVEQRSVGNKRFKDPSVAGRLLRTLRGTESALVILDRAESFLREYLPQYYDAIGLRPGASDADRRKLAQAAGLKELPPDLDMLLGWHDGQDGGGSLFEDSVDFGGWKLVSIESALQQMEWGRELGNFRSSFIPVLENGSGDCVVCDTAREGRLYSWWHESPEDSSEVAPGLIQFLRQTLEVWPHLFAEFRWSKLSFDLENTQLAAYSPAVLHWTRLQRLGVGALLLSENGHGVRAMLNAGLDLDGGLIWLQAYADSRMDLWQRLEKLLLSPLPLGKAVSDYEEGLVAGSAHTRVNRNDALFFGYARSRVAKAH